MTTTNRHQLFTLTNNLLGFYMYLFAFVAFTSLTTQFPLSSLGRKYTQLVKKTRENEQIGRHKDQVQC